MTLGVMNALSVFQRTAESIFKDIKFVRICIGDVVTRSRSIEEHINNLIMVFDRIRDGNLKIKLKIHLCCSKCPSAGLN